MAMSVAARLVTADDLLCMPDDGWRYELLHGELRRMPPPGYLHGRTASRIITRLATHVEANRLGVVLSSETGFLLSERPDSVRAPDAAFLSEARLRSTSFAEEKYFPGAPDLAVEVLSPSDTDSEVQAKISAWLQAGTQLVLVADPKQRRVIAHRPGANPEVFGPGSSVDASPAVPGWHLVVDDIFS